MSFLRLVVLAAIVLAVVWLIRRALQRPAAPPAGEAKGAAPADLVRCARCGVHLPRAEARMQGDRIFCSEEHARLGPDRG